MRGIGHFTVGFLFGYAVWWGMTRWRPTLNWRLYGPFLPFALGAFAAVPHGARLLGWAADDAALHPAWNLFLLFPLLEASAWSRRVFGSFEIDVALIGLAWAHLTTRYIGLVRSARTAHAQ